MSNIGAENRVLKPHARSGHVAAMYKEYMLVWGGYYGGSSGHFLDDRYMATEDVWIYHTEVNKWHCQKTRGQLPPGTSGATALVVNQFMYVLFGHTDFGNTNDIYRLNLSKWLWECLRSPVNAQSPSPRDKMVAWEYNNQIFIFGGFGLPIHTYLTTNGDYFWDPSTWSPSRGWNNQLHIWDLEKQTWTNPCCKGTAPTPRAAHAAAHVKDKVYVFGGRHSDRRLNDLHCLHLPTLTWSGSLIVDGELPVGRSWHSLTTVSDTSLLLYGGYTQDNRPLDDSWVLDLTVLQWQQLSSGPALPRLWHTACRVPDGGVLVFGGCCSDILSEEHPSKHCDDLLVLRCRPMPLVKICLERVFSLRDLLQSEWSSLPQTLSELLQMKLPEFSASDMSLGEESSLNSATTCAIS